MSFRNSLTIVASPRPRVGKTLLARLLTDYHRHEGHEVAAFDVNNENTLVQFLPQQASSASINDIKGQMALFDRLIAADSVHKIVDLGSETFAGFFEIADRIGFAEEARVRGIALAVLFVMTPDRSVFEVYSNLSNSFPFTLTAVHNELHGRMLYPDLNWALGSSVGVIRFPALTFGLRKYIETPPLSFEDPNFADRFDATVDARLALQNWLRKAYREFRELELRLLFRDLHSSISSFQLHDVASEI